MGKRCLSELARGIECGDIQRDDYAKTIVEGLKRAKHCNAFVSCIGDASLFGKIAAGTGAPLASIPFSVKDNILTAEFPTSIGTAILKDFNPGIDAELVARLKSLGAVLLGKNNMPELCQSMTCNNPSYGPVLNPVNSAWIAGGSSGGCAVAVATGAVAFSVGSDTGGSIRIPAALCGCVGFRPSTGRYSTHGFFPVSPTFDAPGLMAPCCEDIRWLDALIAGSSSQDRGGSELDAMERDKLRIGVPRAYFFEDLSPLVAAQVELALGRIRSAGATLVEEDLDGVAELNRHVGFPIAFYEMLRETAVFLARHKAGISLEQLLDDIKGPVEKQALGAQLFDMAIDRPTYATALTRNLPCYVGLIDDYFHRHDLDAIAVPTTPLAAVAHRPPGDDGELEHNGKQASTFLSYIRNVEPFSNYGGPCISLPVAPHQERPVGLELIGRRKADRPLLRAATAIEGVVRCTAAR